MTPNKMQNSLFTVTPDELRGINIKLKNNATQLHWVTRNNILSLFRNAQKA